MEQKKTLVLIDGHALAFRQYYALERTHMSTSDGTPTWCVFGFFKAIFELLRNKSFNVDAIAVAFDVSHNTFRVEKYSEYKSNRKAMPDPMRIQMDLIKQGLEVFKIPVYTKEGYEADDVIGTISKKACDLGHNVLILTGDQDSFQLIDEQGCVKVILPSKGELTTYDWDKVYEKLEVYPNQIVDYKSLCGDSSDNIPGIRGVGSKSAVRLLKEYGTLAGVLENYEQSEKTSIKRSIQQGQDMAKLSYFLATIIRNLDIEFDFNKACIEVPDVNAVTDFFKKLQFYSLIKQIDSVMSLFNNVTSCEKEHDVSNSSSEAGQLRLNFSTHHEFDGVNNYSFDFELVDTDEKLKAAILQLKDKSLICCYVDADMKDIVDSALTGIAFAYNDGITYRDGSILSQDVLPKSKIYYIPLGHSNTTAKQLDLSAVLPEIKDILEDVNIKKVTHNVKTHYGLLKNFGIESRGFVLDVLLASFVKDSSRNHELEVQAIENLGCTIIDYHGARKGPNRILKLKDSDLDIASIYIAEVADTILRLTQYWIGCLTAKENEILETIDMPLSYVLADMELTGAALDAKMLAKYEKVLGERVELVVKQIYDLAGEGFNLNSPRQISAILYDKLQISKRKKRSTSAEVLEELSDKHEICKLILQYRKYNKLKSVYADALPQLASPKDGRIHTTYNLASTVTGRLSSSNPNLQNIPIRTEDGSIIRSAFVPGDRENNLILSADYSQIELRILAHISEEPHLLNAFTNNVDIHTLTASNVFDVPVEEVTKQMRYRAKAVNFGIIYGQTRFGLAKALGISNTDAENFIERYFKTYPNIKRYMKRITEMVEKEGYAETLFGRRRYFTKELDSPIASVREFARRAAINYPMQGTGADLIKLAMIECDRRLRELDLKSKMIIQVHDEIVIEVLKEELDLVKKVVVESMQLGQPLKVPLVVDVSVGETWKD